jgi:hypothetical protein
MMSPTFAPAIMNAAITSVYRVMAFWMPVTVVSKSATRVEISSTLPVLGGEGAVVMRAHHRTIPADVPHRACPAGRARSCPAPAASVLA